MENCLFCKIINKEIPASVEHEDKEIIAFNDISPKAPIHILIIPKKHIESINDINQEDSNVIGKTFLVAKEIAKKKGIDQNGYRICTNTEKDAGQIVKHLHFHLLGGKKLEDIG